MDSRCVWDVRALQDWVRFPYVSFCPTSQGRARTHTNVNRYHYRNVLQIQSAQAGRTVDRPWMGHSLSIWYVTEPLSSPQTVWTRTHSQLKPADLARVDKPCHPDSSLPRIPRCRSHSLRGMYSFFHNRFGSSPVHDAVLMLP